MTILDIIQSLGLTLKKASATNGGEFCGACPWCGGRDRFRIWPEHPKGTGGRFWCRQCRRSGDAIQFLRDYQNMSYQEAYQAVTGQNPSNFSFARQGKQKSNSGQNTQSQRPYQPQNYSLPSRKWLDQAGDLVGKAHQTLLEYQPGLEYLKQRGFNEDFIKRWKFGWIRQDKYDNLQKWGIQGPENKKVWLPSGLLIPMWQNIGDCPFPDTIKLKIRRPEQERKKFNPAAKYWLVRGGYSGPVILSRYGDFRLPCVIVESELDGLLLLQDCGDLVNILCLGSATIRPDETMAELLKQMPKLFLAFDNDSGGGSGARWWIKNFKNVMLCVPFSGKDVTEFRQNGYDLRLWIQAAMREAGLLSETKAQSVSLQEKQSEPAYQDKQEQIKELKRQLFRILPKLRGHVNFAEGRMWFDLPGISNKDVEQWELFGKAESLFWAILELQQAG